MSNGSQNYTLKAITILITTLLTLFFTIYYLWPAFKILEGSKKPETTVQKNLPKNN